MAGLFYVVSTLACWAGVVCLILGLYRVGARGSFWPWLLASGLLLVVSSTTFFSKAGLSIPLIWPILPFSGWACLALVAASVILGCYGLLENRMVSRLKQAGFCLVAAVLFGFLFVLQGEKAQVIKGSIPVSFQGIAAVLVLALAAVYVMGRAGRNANTNRVVGVTATHVALLAGCVVFGIPLLWMLITSFKEDQDLSSSSGLVWVPRVQQTKPNPRPDPPLYNATYRGLNVVGSIIQKEQNGMVRINILHPISLAGYTTEALQSELKEAPQKAPIVNGTYNGQAVEGLVVKEMSDGRRQVLVELPTRLAGTTYAALPQDVVPVRKIGLRWQNYTEALEFLPVETDFGLLYLRNTLIIVILSVIGTVLSSSIVAYAFSRMRFPGRELLFAVLLSTMMLPSAVTMLPTFLIFKQLGWIDTLTPLWAPAFFAGAFNVFLLRQFFKSIPNELEDAAKIDGCSYLKSYWSVMLPQIKPALAVVGIWTFIGAWNNFMGPLIYINSPDKMPISYATQLFHTDRSSQPGLIMAFSVMAIIPVLVLFFVAQRFFFEGVQIGGLSNK
jgi:multiple sugar transport system permease protein